LDIDGIRTPVISELSSDNYEKVANSDATGGDGDSNRYRSPTPSGGRESTHVIEIEIEEDPNEILDIEVLWEGYADDCSQMELYIWNDFKGEWSDGENLYGQNRFMDNWAGNRDGYLGGNIRQDFEDYVGSNNEITLLLYTERTTYKSFHDYASIIVTVSNDPPDDPVISGQTSGEPGTSYLYSFISEEPDGEDVSYYIDWGDGNITDWTDFISPETSYSESHTWDSRDSYEIRAKAKYPNGAESDWSTLKVSIPRNRSIFSNPSFSRIIEYFSNAFSILRLILSLQ
jgi:hypothetical protein